MRRKPCWTATIVICALAPCTAGCPLPIAHTETLSPPLVGVFTHDDGTPVPGARVAVSSEWGDAACVHATRLTTTDSAGLFRLPATEKRHRILWIIPGFDYAMPTYNLCVATENAQFAYRGYLSSRWLAPLGGEGSLDSITCLEWALNERPTVICSGTKESLQSTGGGVLVTGGHWTDEKATGWYRIILTGHTQDVRHAYLQWVEPSGTDPLQAVRLTRELPVDFGSIDGAAYAKISEHGQRWCATVAPVWSSHRPGSKWPGWRFDLGPPGEVRQVEEC